jgi:hypothetical protein
MSETETLPLSAQTLAEMELGRQRVAEAQRRIDAAKAQNEKLPEPEEGIEIVELKPRRQGRNVKLERVAAAPVVSEPEPEPAAEPPTAADPLDELLNA